MAASLYGFMGSHVGSLGLLPVSQLTMATEMEQVLLEMELIDVEEQLVPKMLRSNSHDIARSPSMNCWPFGSLYNFSKRICRGGRFSVPPR